MYQISHQVAVMDASRFVRQYRDVPRFMGYCTRCNSYNRVWGCPPFDFDVEALTDGYAQVTLWATVVAFDEQTRAECTDDEQRRRISARALDEAWRVVLPFLYEQEKAHLGSRIFTGRCRLCRPRRCSRVDGLPCRKPQLMRHSLESVGYDVSAAVRDMLGIELQWSTDGRLPGSITLVTAMFSPMTVTPRLPSPVGVADGTAVGSVAKKL